MDTDMVSNMVKNQLRNHKANFCFILFYREACILNFLIGRKLFAKSEMVDTFSTQNGWYSNELFTELLNKEIKRSSRTSQPLSYLVIDLSSNENGKVNDRNGDYFLYLKELIVVLAENTRDIDIKCVSNYYEISIVLIDTALDGAKTFTQKISKGIFDRVRDFNKKELFEIMKNAKVLTYPLNRLSGEGTIEAKPVVVSSFESNKDECVKSSDDSDSQLLIDWSNVSREHASLSATEDIPNDKIDESYYTFTYKILKRFVDILGSVTAIIFLSPVMALIAISLKCTSRGPVLFKQKRLGYKGKPFTFLKFRSMKTDTNDQIHRDYIDKLINGKSDEINQGSAEKPKYKIINDPRVTRLGHFLRKSSLDELPQFFNVFSGYMSLVGPRPPISYEVDFYKSWHLRRILEVRPGLTGLWQVSGRSLTTFDEMVRMDLQYVNRKSILLDNIIMLKTIFAVLNFKGAD